MGCGMVLTRRQARVAALRSGKAPSPLASPMHSPVSPVPRDHRSALHHASATEAEPLHALATKSCWLGNVFVSYALAASYGGSDRSLDARKLFDESRNNVFGNTVLAGYVNAGKWVPVLEFASKLLELGLQVDGYTMMAVVRACGDLADADSGSQAHGQSIRRVRSVELDVFLTSALVDIKKSRNIPWFLTVCCNTLGHAIVHNLAFLYLQLLGLLRAMTNF
ncbi:hypothetical protein GUJ93_ZPchr0008g11547 [Zizania palustris]|uniref:Pentatricopeptide repeat-containing protein n=1 Tax=Zizania palustris TaxID=103762 RepID=A0A8J5RJX7_ZIZPA|nr:hypothetical protein GUJ93_ZPchr0008g11547 [Zizania palustris]